MRGLRRCVSASRLRPRARGMMPFGRAPIRARTEAGSTAKRGRVVKKPETDASESKPAPDASNKKKPATGAVIDSHPVGTGDAAGAAKVPAMPKVESKLVGSGTGPAAAAPKSAAAAESAAASVTSKPTEKPAAKPSDAAAKPAATPAQTPTSTPTSTPAKSETRVIEVRKAGFMPTLLGGIIAAGLGAGATYWAIPKLPPAWQPGAGQGDQQGSLDEVRAVATEVARAEIQTQLDAVSGRAADAGADAARQLLADSGPSGASVADAEALQAQQEKLAALERTVADLAARPAVPAVAPGDADGQLQALLSDMNARMTEQQRRLDELSARPAGDAGSAEQLQGFAAQAQALESQIAAAADAAEKRISAAESQAAQLQDSAEAANRRARISAAAAALQAALSSGGARDQALAELQAAGVQPPAVLSGEVATLAQLRAEFPAAAREGLAAALKAAPANDGAMGVIGNFLRVQTGARSVEPREGSDPDAVLSRADAAVKAGDIPGALSEIGALPQPGQDAMSGWSAQARTWVEANAALTALAAGSM